MMNCDRCGDSGTDFAHCEGCKRNFHFECAGTKETTYRKKNKEARAAWRCITCKPNRSGNSTASPVSERDMASVNSDMNSATLKNILDKLSKLDELDKISSQVNDLSKSVTFMSDQYDKLFVELADYKKMCVENSKEILLLKNENQYLNHEMKKMQTNIRKMEQNALSDSVEIFGVKQLENENVKHIVMKIGHELRLPCADNEIVLASRRPQSKIGSRSGNTTKPPAIVVKFNNTSVREKWLEKKRSGLNSNNIVGGVSGDPIFINENLCPAVRELFWNARVRAKKCNIKYVWVKNGVVFMRKTDGEAAKSIQGLDDLPRLPSDALEKAPNTSGVEANDDIARAGAWAGSRLT